MGTSAAAERPGHSTRARGFRLTRRVFWDLAVYMIGLGLAVGLVFPPFAEQLGVPARYAHRPAFEAACLLAGFLVGAMNYALCRGLVGGRLAELSAHLRSVADTIARAGAGGQWSASSSTSHRISVDSDDQLGHTAVAFNSLLDALEAGEHFRSLVRNASDVISIVDASARISYQTPSVGWILGYPPDSLLGSDVHALVHPDDRADFVAHLETVVRGDAQAGSVVTRVRHRNGTWRWVETVANNLLADPAVAGIVLTTRDVSDRKDLEERLRTQAFHDPLTSLPNRALFMERLRAAEQRHASTGETVTVLFLDLDNLKAVNDNFGHEGGDVLLQVVTERIGACLRPEDTLARLSGDEFAILITGADSAVTAQQIADRVLGSLQEPVRLRDRDVRTGVSIGIATSSTCVSSQIGLLRAADVAMYVAKSSGKGRIEVFQPHHHAAQLRQEQLRADLHQALEHQQFVLHYQAIVDLGTGCTKGFEALLRWEHPERGMVAPSEFIPLAEETGLIIAIGEWVMREACRQAAQWERVSFDHGLRMSVNVSARQFQHPGLVRCVVEALQHCGLDPSALTLEITETLLVQDTVGTTRKLRELQDLGITVALDDFGTGYSSLSYLRRFPIDILKVDKSFIDNLVTSEEDRAVTAAILQLGQTLQLEVVAEGIETPEQAAELARLGCPTGQGYHFARPLPAGQAVALLPERAVQAV